MHKEYADIQQWRITGLHNVFEPEYVPNSCTHECESDVFFFICQLIKLRQKLAAGAKILAETIPVAKSSCMITGTIKQRLLCSFT